MDPVARAHARVIHGHQRAIEVVQGCARYVGEPHRCQPRERRPPQSPKNLPEFPFAFRPADESGEVLSIKPGQSAIRSHPKESIPGLRNGIYFVVGQTLFDGEISVR